MSDLPAALAFLGVQDAFDEASVAVLPVPYDLTTTYQPGARFGPRALLTASLNVELFDEELRWDPSQVGIHTMQPIEPLATGPQAMVPQIAEDVRGLFRAGKFPVILGGDHSISIGAFEALRDGVITVYAANTWRPYVHVADMADIFIRALNASIETVGGQLFNAGSTEQNYVKRDIAKFIEEAIPGLRVTSIDKVDDKRTYRVDFTKLREVLGFQPRRSVQEGIRELIWAIRSGVLTFEDYESNRLQSQV